MDSPHSQSIGSPTSRRNFTATNRPRRIIFRNTGNISSPHANIKPGAALDTLILGQNEAAEDLAEALAKEDEMDDTPGPTSYLLPDTIGKQVLSTYKTPQAPVFGYSRKGGSLKVKEAEAPGPGAYHRETPLGGSSVSNIRRAPVYTLSMTERWSGETFGGKQNTPGPGQYGRDMVDLNFKRPPSYTMGTRREDTSKRGSKSTPAPGTYKCMESIGKMVLSTKKNTIAASFGVGDRPELVPPAKHDAAPGDYTINDSLGSQVDSRRKSAPSFTMIGRQESKPKPTSMRTGPGYYRVESSIGHQRVSSKTTGPSFSMSGRTKFGSYMR